MWGSFILAVAFVLVLVYVPGYLFSRAFFNSAASSLAFAPVATLVLLVVLGIVVFPLKHSVVCFAVAHAFSGIHSLCSFS